MTVNEVKEALPDVRVRRADNSVVVCRVTGRRNDFASVTVPASSMAHDFEWSWEAVAQAVTDGTPLTM